MCYHDSNFRFLLSLTTQCSQEVHGTLEHALEEIDIMTCSIVRTRSMVGERWIAGRTRVPVETGLSAIWAVDQTETHLSKLQIEDICQRYERMARPRGNYHHS